MHLFHKSRMAAGILFLSALFLPNLSLSSYAASEIQVVLEGNYVEGKVNDPVTKSTRTAYIYNGNPELTLRSGDGAISSAELITYSNEYVEGADCGVRNRIVKKSVPLNTDTKLLPEEYFQTAQGNGSLYDFANRCFVLRVYRDSGDSSYEDYYFGIVDGNMYQEMQKNAVERAAEKAAEDAKRRQELGPLVKR